MREIFDEAILQTQGSADEDMERRISEGFLMHAAIIQKIESKAKIEH